MADEKISFKTADETIEDVDSWTRKLKEWLPKVDQAKLAEYAKALHQNDIHTVEALAQLESRDLADLGIAVGHRPIILREARTDVAPPRIHGDITSHLTPYQFVCGNFGWKLRGMGQELRSWKLWRGFFGEFFASAFYVFILNSIIVSSGVLEVVAASGNPAAALVLSVPRYLSIAVGAGFAFALANYTFFLASGGHVTPAITFALLWNGHVTLLTWAVYLIAQMAGAMVATGFVKICQFSYFDNVLGGANVVRAGYTAGSSVGIEVLTTFILGLVALSFYEHIPRKRTDWFGHLALGFVFLTVHLIALPINGASMNPARSFASSAVFDGQWADQWTWWLGPAIGAVIATLFYEMFLREKSGETFSRRRKLT